MRALEENVELESDVTKEEMTEREDWWNAEDLMQLILSGGSVGGASLHALVIHEHAHWDRWCC